MKAELLKRIDEDLGPLFCRAFARPQTAVRYPIPESLEGPVLVIRPGGVGDAVMLLPMLSALRTLLPGRPVEVLCESRNREVFRLADPSLALLTYDKDPLHVLRRLRTARYALVLDTEQYHHFSAILAAWTRAPIRTGFKINTRRNALYTHLVSYDLDGPEDVQFGRLATAAAGGGAPLALSPRHGILAGARLPAIPEPWAEALTRQKPFAAVHVGGSAPCKRWSASRFASLCDRLGAESGLCPVLIGGSADRRIADAVASQCHETPVNACGALSLAQSAAVCRTAAVFIGPDSGIAHLALALGTPVVALFGPSDPLKWGPGAPGRVVRFPVPCGPCAIFGYNKPCRIHACMAGITVGAVLEAVRDIGTTVCTSPPDDLRTAVRSAPPSVPGG